MEIRKFESYNGDSKLDEAEMLSEIFFEECDNFGSEEIRNLPNSFIYLIFYFIQVEELEIKQIMSCKDFIQDYEDLCLMPGSSNIILRITLTKTQFKDLKKKLILNRTANKYNL